MGTPGGLSARTCLSPTIVCALVTSFHAEGRWPWILAAPPLETSGGILGAEGTWHGCGETCAISTLGPTFPSPLPSALTNVRLDIWPSGDLLLSKGLPETTG